jgi:hypothetical protein
VPRELQEFRDSQDSQELRDSQVKMESLAIQELRE